VPVERGIEQSRLLHDPGVAEARVDDDYSRTFQRLSKTLISCRHPSCSLRSREPCNADGPSLRISQLLEGLSGGEPHVVEVRGGPRGDGSGGHPVDEIDDGNAPGGVRSDEVVQAVCRNCSKDQTVGPTLDAVSDLSLLHLYVFIAPGLEDIQPHPETPCLLDQRRVDGEPVVIFEMRDCRAHLPRLARMR